MLPTPRTGVDRAVLIVPATVPPPCARMPSSRRYFNKVSKFGLGDGYLATCQKACDVIAACTGITAKPAGTECHLNGEGLKSSDEAAAEQASGVGGWSGYYSYSGSGSIARTSGTSGYVCYKKTDDGTGTTMRAPLLLPAAA